MLSQFLLKLKEAEALGHALVESAQHAHVVDQTEAALNSIRIAIGLIHPIAPSAPTPPVAPAATAAPKSDEGGQPPSPPGLLNS